MQISCQEFLNQLYIIENSDDISVGKACPEKGITEEFINHLSHCPNCKAEFEKLKKMNALLKDCLPKAENNGVTLSEKVSERIAKKDLRELHSREIYPNKKHFHVPYATLTAAALILVILASSSSWLWSILPGSTIKDKAVTDSQSKADSGNSEESFIYSADSVLSDKKTDSELSKDKASGSGATNDTNVLSGSNETKDSSAPLGATSGAANGSAKSTSKPKNSVPLNKSRETNSYNNSADSGSNAPAPSAKTSESIENNDTQNETASNTTGITGSPDGSSESDSVSEAAGNEGEVITGNAGNAEAADTNGENSDAGNDASDSTLFTIRSVGGPTDDNSAGGSGATQKTATEFSQEFYDTVNKANSKAANPISIELLKSVGEEEFFKWYNAIKDFEKEYTEEYFKKYFQIENSDSEN